jgi:hypothetical protein
MKPKRKARLSPTKSTAGTRPRCELCGKTKNLTKTACCGNWICDDETDQVLRLWEGDYPREEGYSTQGKKYWCDRCSSSSNIAVACFWPMIADGLT